MHPSVEDFYNGISFDCYTFLGAHPATQGWRFCLWAPHAQRVQLLGDWNGWNLYQTTELSFCEDGLWRGFAPAAQEGQLYKYNILCADGVWRLRRDPFAFGFEALPGTASRLIRLDFAFAPSRPGRQWQTAECGAAIYELSAGGWRRHLGSGDAYSYHQLGEALLPWMEKLHFTHAEFMPLAEYPFDGSWGYQGNGYFAPTARFGSPAEFAALVDDLHRAGRSVVMDFVPVHFALDEGGLALFDGAPLFEPGSWAGQSPWGSPYFDFGRPEIRSFLLSAAALWLHIYQCDALRLDAVAHALHHIPEAYRFFQTLTAGLHARFPGVWLIAEAGDSHRATIPTAQDGLGFDASWQASRLNAVAGYLAAEPDARPALFGPVAHCMDDWFARRHLAVCSHDENAGVALAARLYGDTMQRLSQARLVYFLQYLLPGPKLNFMGCELAQQAGFSADRELDWYRLADERFAAFPDYFAGLTGLYLGHPALYAEDASSFCWLVRDAATGLLAWLRRAGGETMLCACTLGGGALPDIQLALDFTPHFCEVLFRTGWPDGDVQLQGNALHFGLPVYGGIVVQLQ